MIKSFILAVTSISYILGTVNIAEAKVKKSDKKVDREQTCLDQKSNSSQALNISTADLRAICQIIANHYRTVNVNYLKHQLFVENYPEKQSGSIRTLSIFAIEVTGLNLVSHVKDSDKKSDVAKLKIALNYRVYDWAINKKAWELDQFSNQDGGEIEVELYKKNSKWSYDDKKNQTWYSDIRLSKEASQNDI